MLEEISSEVIAAVDEVRRSVGFVQYEIVIQLLLEQRGVRDWLSLGVGSIDSIPIVHYLFNINRKIQDFVNNYFAVNSIVTLVDLDSALTTFLTAFRLPTIYSFLTNLNLLSQTTQGPDPYEIDLENLVSAESVSTIRCFEDYGLGSFHACPLIRKFIPYEPSTISLQSTVRLMELFHEFLRQSERNRCVKSFMFAREGEPAAEDFLPFLLSHFKISSLSEIGAYIFLEKWKRDSQQTILEMKMVSRLQTRLSFESLASKLNTSENEPIKQDPHKTSSRLSLDSLRIKVRRTQKSENPLIDDLIQRCDRHFEASPYSLSHQKIAGFVDLLIKESSQNRSSLPTEDQGRQKDKLETTLKEVATEYLYLVFGKSSKIKRKFKVTVPEVSSELAPDASFLRSDLELTRAGDSQDIIWCENHGRSDSLGKEGVSCSTGEEALKEFPLQFNRSNLSSAEIDDLIEVVDSAQIQSTFSEEAFQRYKEDALNYYRTERASRGSLPSTQEEVGYWGEQLVYLYLQRTLPLGSGDLKYSVEWRNEKVESLAFYDLLVTEEFRVDSEGSSKRRKRQKCYFLEVKSSQWEHKNAFSLSWKEFQYLYHPQERSAVFGSSAATSLPTYYIVRANNVFDWTKVRLVVLKDVPKLLETGRVQLCLAV